MSTVGGLLLFPHIVLNPCQLQPGPLGKPCPAPQAVSPSSDSTGLGNVLCSILSEAEDHCFLESWVLVCKMGTKLRSPGGREECRRGPPGTCQEPWDSHTHERLLGHLGASPGDGGLSLMDRQMDRGAWAGHQGQEASWKGQQRECRARCGGRQQGPPLPPEGHTTHGCHLSTSYSCEPGDHNPQNPGMPSWG